MDALNGRAADWWAERWQEAETRDAFRVALAVSLPDADWETYCEYDPEGVLLEAVQKVKPGFGGALFSHKGLLPAKTGLQRRGAELFGKDGYGAAWKRV